MSNEDLRVEALRLAEGLVKPGAAAEQVVQQAKILLAFLQGKA